MTAPAPEAAPARPEEIRALTGLRILAALWVLLFHFGATGGVEGTRWFTPLQPLVKAGELGVDLFYVLSGFVITLTYLDTLGRRPSGRRVVGFWWARVCRIWPVYAVVTTLFGAWLLAKREAGATHDYAYQAVEPVLDLPHYLEQLGMVQLWHRPFFDGSSFVGPAWSISAEWLAYVCFPLLALGLYRLRRAGPVVTGAMAIAAMVPLGWWTWATGDIHQPWSWALRIGGGFVAGALTCLAVRRIPARRWVARTAAAVAALAMAGVVAGLWVIPRLTSSAPASGWAVVVLFPVLVGALALGSGGVGRVLASRLLVHGGRISYSLYLVHVPVLEVFWTAMAMFPALHAGRPLWFAGVVLTPVVALLLAHASYRWLEEPARRALRRRGPGGWARRDHAVVRAVAAEVASGPAD